MSSHIRPIAGTHAGGRNTSSSRLRYLLLFKSLAWQIPYLPGF
jgi:hypothetical protein